MTRKRARKILMSIGTSRNHANWGLTAKPRWKTNAGVVEDTLAITLYAKLLRQPAADVAPVVRCRDCKHRTEYGNCGHPRQKGVLPSAYPYDFCSYGDRRVDHLALEAETTQIIDGCCTACGAFMDCCEAAEYKFCPYCAKRIV